MKKKSESTIWGIILLLAAVFVLLNNLGFFVHINVFTLLISVFLVYCIGKSVRWLNWGGILFPIAFLCIIYARPLHITALTPGPVLIAALLGTIGLSLLFHPNHHYNGTHYYHQEFSESVEHTAENTVNCQVSFCGSVKYIDTKDFKQANLKCSFGSLKVYFDNATILDNHADIYADVSFGEIQLYLPKEWNTENRMTCSFGDIEEIHKCPQSGYPTVTLYGNASFGDCKIFYI